MPQRTLALLLLTIPVAVYAQVPSRVEVTSGRPVAKALDKFELHGSFAVHYEDVRFENPSDIEDVSAMVRKPEHVGETRRVLVPKARSLASSFVLNASGRFADVLSLEQATQGLLAANDAASMPGRYRIDRFGDHDIFVVPTHVRSAEGNLTENLSVLMTPISISVERVRGIEALQQVMDLASRLSGQQIEPGMLPFAGLARTIVSLDVRDKPAGHVIADILRQTGGGFSIRMFYKPDVKYYALNIQPVLGTVPHPETPIPPEGGTAVGNGEGRPPWARRQ